MPAFSVPSHLALANSDASPDSYSELRSPPHPPGVTISRALSAVLCIVTVAILLRRWRKRRNHRNQELTHQKTKEPSLPPHLHKTQNHSLNPSSPPTHPAATPPNPLAVSSPAPPLPHPSAFPAPTIRRRSSYPLARSPTSLPNHQPDEPDPPEETAPTTTTTSSRAQLAPAGVRRHDTLLAVSGCRRHVLVLGGGSDDLTRLVADAAGAGRGAAGGRE